MTILVDAAIWQWRGRQWAHMVSDSSFAELHDFATTIGKPRLMFQGDHYDVDTEHRALALEHGAIAVDSRDIVRSLRAAGLRKRPSDPQIDWQRTVRTSVDSLPDMLAALEPITEPVGGRALLSELQSVVKVAGLRGGGIDVLALTGSRDLAVAVSAPDGQWNRRPDPGRAAVAEGYVSSFQGVTTLELLTGPGTQG